MAKRTLATDFKDDILAESMDGKRRYRLVANGDGTYCLEDASVYEQTGSIYGAKQVNEANEAINSAADSAKIIDDIDAVLANTVGGYMAGAMAVRGLDGKLKTVAKTGSYNDLTDKPTIPSGAAANYAVADNDTTNSAASLVTARVAYEHGTEIDDLSKTIEKRLPDGTGIEWDGTNFYGTTTDGVKKKLGRTGTIAGVGVYFDDPPHSVLKTWQGGCVKWDDDKLIVTVEDDYAQGHLTVGTVIGKRNRPQTWGDTTEGFITLRY
jgi:hypothetical protein